MGEQFCLTRNVVEIEVSLSQTHMEASYFRQLGKKKNPEVQTLDRCTTSGVKSSVLICCLCDEFTIRLVAGCWGVCPLFD